MPNARSRVARRLRRDQTDVEKKFLMAVRNRELCGVKIRRQVPIHDYVIDFLCPEYKLIIELDGGQHAASKADATRDAQLEALGFRIVRFWNHDVLNNLDGVLQTLAAELGASPSPGGRRPG